MTGYLIFVFVHFSEWLVSWVWFECLFLHWAWSLWCYWNVVDRMLLSRHTTVMMMMVVSWRWRWWLTQPPAVAAAVIFRTVNISSQLVIFCASVTTSTSTTTPATPWIIDHLLLYNCVPSWPGPGQDTSTQRRDNNIVVGHFLIPEFVHFLQSKLINFGET